jgi:hypothetical protein
MNKDNVKAVVGILKNGVKHDRKSGVASCLGNAWYDHGFIYATDRFRIARIPVRFDIPDLSYIGIKELSDWANTKGRSISDDIDWSSLAWKKPHFSFPAASLLFDESLYDQSSSLSPYVSLNPGYMMDGLRFLTQREYAGGIPRIDVRFQNDHPAIKPVWIENGNGLVYLIVPLHR